MSAARSSSRSPRSEEDFDDLPPPYTLRPTDEVTLEVGPGRPYQRAPPQQYRPSQVLRRQNRSGPPGELSDFARDFYAAGDRESRSAESLSQSLPRSPPRHPQSQNSIPDDGRPTRTPVPGHPLLNNGKTLVYPAGYECSKCHNTGYKAYDPSNPCRKCWEKYSKPYSGPIIYSSWMPGPSNRQRPLLNLRSSITGPSHSLSRSISTLVNQVRDDLSSYPGNSARGSPPPSSSQVYPSLRNTSAPPPSSPRHQFDYASTPMNSRTSSTCPRNFPTPPVVLQPGDPRIGGQLCRNCFGSGRTLGFLLLSERPCGVCGGTGRLL